MARPKGSKNKSNSESSTDNSSTIEETINCETSTLTRVPWKKEVEAEDNSNSEGPQKYRRDQHGLLFNVNYIFNEDGSINWRSMIKDEQLFPNRSWFESRKQDAPRSINGLKDHQLLIKLGGIKEIARLRGFSEVSYSIQKCDHDHVAVSCSMSFIPNYETGGREVRFQDMANATTKNTSSFATKFLETIACNRAFVRCVRNFLNIHIVGDDEMDKSSGKPAQSSGGSLTPEGMLEAQVTDKLFCSNFEEFRAVLRDWWKEGKYKNGDVKEWNSFSDIPASEARVLMKLING